MLNGISILSVSSIGLIWFSSLTSGTDKRIVQKRLLILAYIKASSITISTTNVIVLKILSTFKKDFHIIYMYYLK